MRSLGAGSLVVAAVAVVMLTGCQKATVFNPYARQLTEVKTCLQGQGYAVRGLSSWVLPISGLPQPLQSLHVPFLSKRVQWSLLIVEVGLLKVAPGGYIREVALFFYPTVARARVDQRRFNRPPISEHRRRIRNVLYERPPDARSRVFRVIEECVRSSSLPERLVGRTR